MCDSFEELFSFSFVGDEISGEMMLAQTGVVTMFVPMIPDVFGFGLLKSSMAMKTPCGFCFCPILTVSAGLGLGVFLANGTNF